MTTPFVITRDPPQPAHGDTTEPFKTVCPPDWEGTQAPERRWLVKDRIPAGDVSILLGDGGTGKTLIALQLATAMARGAQDWLGAVIEPGSVMMYSAEEDEDESRRRIERIAELGGFRLADLPGLHLHFPQIDKALLGNFARLRIRTT
jgi:RecA-family ATPase